MKKLTTIAAGCGILATIALAGCSPASETTPTDTPSTSAATSTETATPTAEAITADPYVTEAPSSAEEAISFASTADATFDDLVWALYANPSASADLGALAAGDPLDKALENAATLKDLGAHIEGDSSFEVDRSATYTQDTVDQGSGQSVPFGLVNLKGCADYSRVSIVRASGEIEPFTDPQRVRVTSVLVYSPSDGRWVLTGGGTDEPVTTC
ncbi:hypothetical protein [Pseudoclavibacter sp. AY1H1]|uniref:hypothetical protein n=1 Tax=Pseudoclavibacter sp. AY1H1 TaxID=2080584 RepID=UPI000CE76173|nr:hypothetical protein [Pseudoclavibacter sp. AY1H1]PPF32663.1 hypothetical protein C5E05_19355 [Pseudoclavibacter sp. AY1H1]